MLLQLNQSSTQASSHLRTGNYTTDAFSVTQRVATDTIFRCIDQAAI